MKLSSDQLPLPNTIFLMGRMGVGKDYVGEALIEHRGFTKLAFADPAKQEVADRNGISCAELEANKEKYRPELQDLGHGKRLKNINHWIDRWKVEREKIDGPVVCTDCRHVNEAVFAIQQHDSVLIKVEVAKEIRDERLRQLYGEVDESLHYHPSEIECDHSPFQLILPGTIPYERICNVIAKQLVGWRQMGEPIMQIDRKTALQFKAG